MTSGQGSLRNIKNPNHNYLRIFRPSKLFIDIVFKHATLPVDHNASGPNEYLVQYKFYFENVCSQTSFYIFVNQIVCTCTCTCLANVPTLPIMFYLALITKRYPQVVNLWACSTGGSLSTLLIANVLKTYLAVNNWIFARIWTSNAKIWILPVYHA